MNRADATHKLTGGKITVALTDKDIKGMQDIIKNISGVKPDPTSLARIFVRATAHRVLRGEVSFQDLYNQFHQQPIQVGGQS